MGHYHSVSSAIFARITRQRAVAAAARHAGRQAAHDTTASARAAKKREEHRHAIANRPRGQTRVIDHRDDGSPVYRAIAAFRARPHTKPEDRKAQPEPAIEAVNGWRYNVRPTAERIAAALKAEAPQAPISDRLKVEGVEFVAQRLASRIYQRAARKVRMARRRRRGF